MFDKLFNRLKAPSATSEPKPPKPTPTAPSSQAPIAAAQSGSRLEAFREEWDDQMETSHEVIEGNGGNTDWAAWTDAVKEEDKYFAATEPMPLNPNTEKQ
jgi:hypothetical protein